MSTLQTADYRVNWNATPMKIDWTIIEYPLWQGNGFSDTHRYQEPFEKITTAYWKKKIV